MYYNYHFPIKKIYILFFINKIHVVHIRKFNENDINY